MSEAETGNVGERSSMPPSVLAPMDERALVADLTRAALAAEFPEELGVFAADEDRYLDGWCGDASGESDEMLGFGLETVTLTPYIVAAATVAVRLVADALAQSVTAEARPLIVRWMRQSFHRESAQAYDLPPLMAGDLIEHIREVIYSTLREHEGLDEGYATLVTDAIVVRLGDASGIARPVPAATELPFSQSSSAVSTNDEVEAAVKEIVKSGRIGFNPPAEMRQGARERVAVAIARSQELDDELRAGLSGRGVARLEDLSTSRLMTVRLRGTAFDVTPLGPEKQLVTGVTLWEFDVLPLRAGRRVLQLCVCMNIRLPGEPNELVARAIPVFERDIRVRVDPVYGTRQFASRHWKLVTTIAGLGSAIAAWIELIHGSP